MDQKGCEIGALLQFRLKIREQRTTHRESIFALKSNIQLSCISITCAASVSELFVLILSHVDFFHLECFKPQICTFLVFQFLNYKAWNAYDITVICLLRVVSSRYLFRYEHSADALKMQQSLECLSNFKLLLIFLFVLAIFFSRDINQMSIEIFCENVKNGALS